MLVRDLIVPVRAWVSGNSFNGENEIFSSSSKISTSSWTSSFSSPSFHLAKRDLTSQIKETSAGILSGFKKVLAIS